MIETRARNNSTLLARALWLAAAAALGLVWVRIVMTTGPLAPAVLVGVPLLLVAALVIVRDPRVGVMAVFVGVLTADFSVPLGFASIELVEVTGWAVTAIVIVQRLATGQSPLPWPPALWWAGALMAWTVVALPSALDQPTALKQLISLLGGILFACAVAAVVRTWQDLKAVAGALVATGAAVAAYGLTKLDEMRALYGGALVEGRLEGPFGHPNGLGAFAAIVLIVAFGYAFSVTTRWGRYLSTAAIVLLAAALMLSLARGAWMGAALGIVLLAAWVPRIRRALLLATGGLVVVAALSSSLLEGSPQLEVVAARVESFGATSPYDSRVEIWAEARREILADPWTGQGPGNFPIASTRSASESNTVQAQHAHNLWLTWAAEAGVPAALAIVAFIVAVAATARRTRSQFEPTAPGRPLIAGFAGALMVVVGQGLVDYPFRDAALFFLVWGIVGCVLGLDRGRQAETSTAESP